MAKCELPELARYKLPGQTPEDEHLALRMMMSQLRSEPPKTLHYLSMANVVLSAATPESPRPAWFDSELQVRDILAVIAKLDRTKHPGYPASLLAMTKGKVIDDYLPWLVQAVYARLIMLSAVGEYCRTPEDFYHTFCADFCGVSIKSEVVKIEKVGRVVVSNSIVTAIVEGLLYGEFNICFKEGRFETYSAIGVGFTKEDSHLLHTTWPDRKASSDVPTFDATKTSNEAGFSVYAVYRSYRMGGLERHQKIKRMMLALEASFVNKIFILSDGRVFAQVVDGSTPSGRDQTSIFNTMDRARRSYAVALYIQIFEGDIDPANNCAGDDCVESHHESRESVYEHLGFPIRDYHELVAPSFCSHFWPVGEKPVGQRIFKSAYNVLCNKTVAEEQTIAFCREYQAHADFPTVFDVISSHRPEMINHVINQRIQ